MPYPFNALIYKLLTMYYYTYKYSYICIIIQTVKHLAIMKYTKCLMSYSTGFDGTDSHSKKAPSYTFTFG